ncbi:MAG: isoprenylcysteine carboxylmethyltransferase family protein [Nanoarchaeota archaeon]|nr:MAG: isoprenylcysteine carboxylmethyltransferase family protein [Nanoarchaeota archaeon]
MADMTGYSRKEKAAAVSASMSPHLFTLLTIFIPLSSSISAFVTGVLLYAAGLTGFVVAVVSYSKTLPETHSAHGVYKISRNPMYVTALMVYTGITVMTLNGLLAVLLIIMILLHHMMIKAEERACSKRFGKQYKQYMENTPRYLLL